MRRFAAALLASLVATGCATSPSLRARDLSDAERTIGSFVDLEEPSALALLQRTVDINSGTLNAAGVTAVGKVFEAEFRAIGFETQWIDQRAQTGRAGHLVALRRGDRGHHVLLIGHLDTVFEPGSGFERYVRRGDKAIGPGVADMKGGDVVILYAMRALAEVGALKGAQISIILTGDEEAPGHPLEVARQPLVKLAQEADVALGFESMIRGPEQDWASYALRGSVAWRLEVEGEMGHSSLIHSEAKGAGAAFEAARILEGFRKMGERVSISPGLMAGGVGLGFNPKTSVLSAHGKANIIPSKVVVLGGLRHHHDRELERIKAKMQRIVDRNLEGTSAELTFYTAYPAMHARPDSRRLLRGYSRISQAVGAPAVGAFDPQRRGAADISFAAPHVSGALAGLGIVGTAVHTPRENADLSSLGAAIKRAAILVYRLTRLEPR